MEINSDLIIENKTLGEIDDKLTRGTMAKLDLLYSGSINMVNTTSEVSGTLAHPWTDYDVLYCLAAPGAFTSSSVELTTVPLFIFRKDNYNQTYAVLWSNIPDSYNGKIRVAVKTSEPNKIFCRALTFTNWTGASVGMVYGIKFIS